MAKKLWVEERSQPAVLWQEATPPVVDVNWLDETSNPVAWNNYGSRVMPYIFWRYKMEVILVPMANPNYPTMDWSGFDGLSLEYRTLISEHFLGLCPKVHRRTIFTQEEDIKNWNRLIATTKPDRANLIEKMRAVTSDEVAEETLTMALSQSFFKDVCDAILWYIEAADPSFVLFINNQLALGGGLFNTKSYWSQELNDKLIATYNGN
jgi:hypothetical protein